MKGSTTVMKQAPNQYGFSVIKSLLLVIAVAGISLIGVYVYRTNATVNSTLQAAQTSAVAAPARLAKKPSATKALTAGWNSYTSKTSHFSANYPQTWVLPAHKELCGAILSSNLEVGPNLQSVIKCGGDGTISQVSIASERGDKRHDKSAGFDAQMYGHVVSTPIEIAGAPGVQTSAVAANQPQGIGSYPDGTVIIKDVIFTLGRTYTAQYVQYPQTQSEGPVLDETAIFKQITASITFK